MVAIEKTIKHITRVQNDTAAKLVTDSGKAIDTESGKVGSANERLHASI
jgi:hypothetical protein